MKEYLNRITKKKSFDDIMYLVFGVFIFIKLLEFISLFYINNQLKYILKVIRYICYAIAALRILYDWKKGEKITLPIIGVGILSVIIGINTDDRILFLTTIILISLRRLNFDRLINIAFKIFFYTFFIVIILSIIEIIPNWEFARGNLPRYSLGFIYPTDAMGIFFTIVLMHFYIRKFNVTYMEILIFSVINILLYKYTNGRVSFLLISCVLILEFFGKNKYIRKFCDSNFIKKITKIACYTAPTILFITLHVLVSLYAVNNNIAFKVNKVLSDRIKYTYQAYRDYDVNMLGNDIKWNGWAGFGYVNIDNVEEFNYDFVDSSYARIILDYGMIFSIILLIGYTFALVENFNKHNYCLILIIFLVLIWSFIEQFIFDVGRNIFVLTLIPFLEIFPVQKLNYSNLIRKLKIMNKKEE